MINYPKCLKEKLISIVKEMAVSPAEFVKNPGKDFSRERKLTFETVVNLLLSMGGNSIYKELLEYFKYDINTVSSSAFVQQRSKILPFAFEYIFNQFTNSFDNFKTFNGYRLLAVDGSLLSIARNPNDSDSYISATNHNSEKGCNYLHLDAMYDLCNRLYIDASISPIKKQNERRTLVDMIERSKLENNVIIVADRGYENYNVFAHIEEKGWKYAIRVKDLKGKNCITSSLVLPSKDEFDYTINLKLTRKQTNEIKSHPEIYKFLPNNVTFDYLSPDKENINKFYPISFRVVRFKISEDSYETIITNLSKEEFTPKMLKMIYHMRWGIETSFRELKYAIGLVNLHSKKVELILQEIFAKLTMYNFCEIITLHVVISQKKRKHDYQVNFTIAIHICKYFFKCYDEHPPNVEALIQKNILPVRKDRQDHRKLRSKTTVSFIYRVA